MSDGHCFISYSNAETEKATAEFAFQLADRLKGEQPFIDIWIDNRSMTPGENWDKQISDAIKSCKCLLFIVSPDSITDNCICADEWDWALRYKKPVVPLLLYKNAEVPFRLNRRKFIDFTGDFETKLSELRNLIKWLDSPEGILQTWKDRLAEAQRDLRREPENKQRIENEIEELKAELKRQEEIVKNPQKAQEQTQKNIAAGLERERQPEKPVASKTSTKFINPPPGIAPNYFQDRSFETHEAVKFLQDDSQRLMTIVGRGGVGKTAMVCRLLKGLEGGELPDGLGNMRVEGIVYLSESGSHRVNFVNIFYDLCKLLPSETSQELDAVYKNPQGSTESKVRALLEKFSGGRVVLLLDNFEPLVDTETFAIRDAELDEALRAFLNGTHTAVNIVLTTRVAPRALNLIQPGRQRVLTLDEGLESPYAENILREMDSDGRMGLKSASADLLNRARERTRGYPRALEALFAILASDRYTTLDELLAMPTPENVVEALVGEAFNRLDTNAQKVMQALAVYNRPVTPAAVDFLLAPHIPAMDSAPILQRLANMHFARKESGRFYLHPVDREFAFGLIAEKDLTTKDTKEKPKDLTAKTAKPAKEDLDFLFESLRSSRTSRFDAFTQHDLLSRAADYFAQARKPRAEWKKLDDLTAQLAEFDLRFVAGDYDTAVRVLTEIDGEYLRIWGHYRLMIDLHERLRGKINDKELTRISIGNLGLANRHIGNVRLAIEYQEKALQLAREMKNRYSEGTWLLNLGNAYDNLGDSRKVIEYCEQALVIAREIGDREGEGAALSNLGDQYSKLGEYDIAFDHYNQALQNAREIRNKYGECKRLNGLAWVLIEKEDLQGAIKLSQEAVQIGREMNSPELCIESSHVLATSLLFSKILKDAFQIVQDADNYDRPNYIFNISALHGIIALRQRDASAARQSFTRAIAQADEILAKTPEFYSALDAKGLALCGLAIADDGRQTMDSGQPSIVYRQQAVETFQQARKIAPHAGVVKSVLRLFDELVKCDNEGILKDVRKAVEGNK